MPKKIKDTKSPQINYWANLLLAFGWITLLLLTFLIYQRYNPQNLAFKINEISQPAYSEKSGIVPTGIKIDSINLLLPVTASEIKNNKWEASTKSVNFLKTSVIPGEKGNSVLYGHNWPNLLGNLKKAEPGDKVTVIYSDNSERNFEIEYKTQVSPSETSILSNSEDNRITLYTCAGFLDTKRLVVVAKLLKA